MNNDDDDKMNFKNKDLLNKSYIIDNEEDDIIILEYNIVTKQDVTLDENNNLENLENLEMASNDINYNNYIKNDNINLSFLENKIDNIEIKINYDNIAVKLIKLEDKIKAIDRSKYIIDDESDETIISNNDDISDDNNKNKNLNSYLLNKKNFNLLKNIKNNIQIYGCSHARCFFRKDISIGNIKIYNNYLSSASISGIINDISSLNYKSIITKKILEMPFDYHVFKLGQIDIEYVYYFKKLKNKLDISKEAFFLDIINKFLLFLKKFVNRYGTKIIIFGSNLCNPTNWDSHLKSILDLNNLPTNLTYESKNNDVINFNLILKKECINNNIKYVDTIKESTKKKYLKLKNKYIGDDYHYKGAENDNIFNEKHSKYGINTYYLFLNTLIKNL